MIKCVLLCYPVSIHMSQLLSTGRPISSQKCGISQCEGWKQIVLQNLILSSI